MQKKNLLACGSVSLLLALTACTKETEKIIIEKQAPSNMLETFSKPSAETCIKASCITIQKSSLGKRYLLLISGKTSGSTPQWYDVKPLVVSFDRSANKVALLGENYNSIYENVKTENFITSFDILSEDEKSITFDWGRGLETLIVQSPYQIDSELGGDEPLTESSFSSMPITGSYVRKIKFDEKNIELEQISRVSTSQVKTEGKKTTLEGREETLALNIQIRAYNLASTFEKKVADSTRRVGFFVTKIAKAEKSREVESLITKWDLDPARGPIVVRISDGIKEDYLEAVKEGVLYWNHVFGREVLTVETHVPESEATPKDRSIMLRWVKWMDAGAAYAIGQSDPLTGEVLRAQVFMPAVFTEVSMANLVRMNGGSPVVGSNAVACDFSESLKELQKLSARATPSQRLRLAQDSIRSTVAHEMGHALGLRHNFAGSYSSKVKTPDILAATKTYLKDPNHPGLETSTSIMDYVSGMDETLMSARIKHSPLSYDKMAMDWAYAKEGDDSALNEKISGYCSDEDIALAGSQGMAIYGCERFDAGNNPFWRKYIGVKYEKLDKVSALFALILDRVYDSEKTKSLVEALPEVQKRARVVLPASFKFMRQVATDVTLNGVPNQLMLSRQALKTGQFLAAKYGVDPTFKKERAANIKEAGGYAYLLNDFLRNEQGQIDLNWFDKQVDALIASGALVRGQTLGGHDYKFTTAEQKKLVQFFKGAAVLNRKSLINDIVNLLPAIDQEAQTSSGAKVKLSAVLPAGMIDAQEAAMLKQLVLDLALAPKGEITLKAGTGLAQTLKVTEKFFSVEEIAEMEPLLNNQALSFNQDLNRALVKATIASETNELLKVMDPLADISTLSPEELENLPGALLTKGLIDSAAYMWLANQVKLFSVF